jgi:hypothetical protein
VLNYTFMQGLVLNTAGSADTVNVNSTEVDTPVTVNTGGGVDTVNVNGTNPAAPVTVVTGAGDDTVNVDTDGAGSAAAVFTAAVETLAALNVGPNGTATLAAGASPGQRVIVTDAFSAAGSGRLDLTNGGMIIDYAPGASPVNAVQTLLATGYAGDAWTGTGIRSSTAAANAALGVGYAENDPAVGGLNVGSFLGQAVDASSLLLRLTVDGDADLDGAVAVSDLGRLSTNFGGANRRWDQGDFSFDRNVDVADLGILSTHFNQSLA